MQRPCFKRFHRDEAAGATIETVLWLPVYVFFLTMIFDTSMTFLNKSEILRVMQDANRAYSVGQIRSLGAVEEAIEAGVGRMGATATVSSILDAGVIRGEVRVRAGDLRGVGVLRLIANIELRMTTQHALEG